MRLYGLQGTAAGRGTRISSCLHMHLALPWQDAHEFFVRAARTHSSLFVLRKRPNSPAQLSAGSRCCSGRCQSPERRPALALRPRSACMMHNSVTFPVSSPFHDSHQRPRLLRWQYRRTLCFAVRRRSVAQVDGRKAGGLAGLTGGRPAWAPAAAAALLTLLLLVRLGERAAARSCSALPRAPPPEAAGRPHRPR